MRRLKFPPVAAWPYLDRVAFEVAFEPGDIQFLNNYVTLHARTGYDDYPEPHRRRHLLRLWLKVAGARTLPPAYGEGRARSGVPRRSQLPVAAAR